MINRRNWELTNEYLDYREEVDQLSAGSLRIEATHIRHILEWAGEISFRFSLDIRPTLPQYMLSARRDGKEEQLSRGYVSRTLSVARRFFSWLLENEWDQKYVQRSWLKTLRPPRMPADRKSKKAVTLEEIRKIAEAPALSLIEERVRAAAVFLWLSGMRIGAFVSMPIRAVDLEERTVIQDPAIGVRTKNLKTATTFLLNIPDLLDVVGVWDAKVRDQLPPKGFWFAPLSPKTGEIDAGCLEIGKHRHNLARRNLASWLKRVGLPYHSPHEFRHGHIHYGIKNAKNMADFKAVSMNVMHSNMQITDAIYSRLADREIKGRIDSLGNGKGTIEIPDSTRELLEEFIAWQTSKRATARSSPSG
jgi:integrase